MKRWIKWVALGLAAVAIIVLVATNVVSANAASKVSDNNVNAAGYVCPGWANYGGEASITQIIGELTGLTPEQIQTQLRDGKSLTEIAVANGITKEALVNAIIDAHTQRLQEQVTAGNITQEQANRVLTNMREHISYMLDWKAGSPASDGQVGHGACGINGGYDPGGMMGGYSGMMSGYGGMMGGTGYGGMMGQGRGNQPGPSNGYGGMGMMGRGGLY